jgi:hypothetical protein
MNKQKSLVCGECGRNTLFEEAIGWRAVITDNRITELFCTSCAEPVASSKKLVDLKFSEYKPQLPLRGKFKPVKSEKEFAKIRSVYMNSEGWSEFETQIGFLLTSTSQKLQKIEVENHQLIPGVFIWIGWSQDTVQRLTFAGNTPSLGLELDIYQTHRLGEMGLTESGSTDKVWTLELSNAERNPANMARVICHVLEFGYFIKHHKIFSMNVTVDD